MPLKSALSVSMSLNLGTKTFKNQFQKNNKDKAYYHTHNYMYINKTYQKLCECNEDIKYYSIKTVS